MIWIRRVEVRCNKIQKSIPRFPIFHSRRMNCAGSDSRASAKSTEIPFLFSKMAIRIYFLPNKINRNFLCYLDWQLQRTECKKWGKKNVTNYKYTSRYIKKDSYNWWRMQLEVRLDLIRWKMSQFCHLNNLKYNANNLIG